MKAFTRECPCLGCTTTIPSYLVMCKPHWAQVPRPLQAEIRMALGEGKEIRAHPTQRYLNAVREAIGRVNERIEAAAAKRQAADRSSNLFSQRRA
jgi:hypothetical protein